MNNANIPERPILTEEASLPNDIRRRLHAMGFATIAQAREAIALTNLPRKDFTEALGDVRQPRDYYNQELELLGKGPEGVSLENQDVEMDSDAGMLEAEMEVVVDRDKNGNPVSGYWYQSDPENIPHNLFLMSVGSNKDRLKDRPYSPILGIKALMRQGAIRISSTMSPDFAKFLHAYYASLLVDLSDQEKEQVLSSDVQNDAYILWFNRMMG